MLQVLNILMMEVFYKNETGLIITESAIPIDGAYSKITKLNGEIKAKEFYRDGKLFRSVYFKEENEDHREILARKSSANVDISIGERKYIGKFKHEKCLHYNDRGIVTGSSIEVFDENNNVIVSSFSFDVVNETPYWNGTSKYYYDESIRSGDSLFECHFTDEGKLIPITIDVEELGLGDHDGTWIYANEEGIKDLMRIFGMSESLAKFYASSQLIPA